MACARCAPPSRSPSACACRAPGGAACVKPARSARVTVAATQFACSWDLPANLERAEQPGARGACRAARRSSCCRSCSRRPISASSRTCGYLQLAESAADSPLLRRFGALAAELAGGAADQLLRARRQCVFQFAGDVRCRWQAAGHLSQIAHPNGPGYQEKFYFTPGDTGFQVWDTRYGRIGAAICWDQWFPESARVMALHGRRAAAVSDRHRQRAAAGAAGGFAAALAAHAAGTCGRQPDAADRQQSHRHRALAAGSAEHCTSASMAPRSSPMPAVRWSPRPARTARR